jgi:thioredoxin reductase (NADPH)
MKKRRRPAEQAPAAKDEAQVRERLRAVFDQFPRPVDLVLFAAPGRNEAYAQAARTTIRELAGLTDKITFREFDLDHDLARKYNVEHSPTLLLNPEQYRIRWLGAPVGEEVQAFVEALILIGHGTKDLSDQAAKLLTRIDSPREVKIFVSPTCPYCPPQIVNGLRAAVARPETISLQIIDVQANPKLAEKYEAFSTPTAFANERLIGQGVQTQELFLASLMRLEPQTVFIPDDDAPEIEVDLVIVGGGPAGLTAGIYAARGGLKAVIVEKGALGGQVALTPVVENYPGLTQVGGKSLVDIMVNHALQYAHIFPGEEVLDIKPGAPLVVTTSRRRFLCRAVLLATGAAHRRLGVPGEDRLAGRGISYCSTCDGPLFKGKKVLMIGGGDSAVTEALHLKHLGVEVTLVHRRDKLRAQARLKENLTASGVPVLYNTEVREIRGRGRVQEVELVDNRTGKTWAAPADGVFVAVGYDPAVELAKKIGVELRPDGYLAQDERHRTNVPGVYGAGDVEGGYKQIVIAAGQGAEAAMAVFEDLVNQYWTADRTA